MSFTTMSMRCAPSRTGASMFDAEKAALISCTMMALTGLTSLAARRLHVPQSILFVIVGAAIAFVPHFPAVELHSENRPP